MEQTRLTARYQLEKDILTLSHLIRVYNKNSKKKHIQILYLSIVLIVITTIIKNYKMYFYFTNEEEKKHERVRK